MAKERFHVIDNPTTGKISEDTSKKEKPKRDRNVCGCKSIVVLYILLMATSMVWMILLYKVFAKHSEISAEIENLRNSRTILKGNDSEISAEIENLRNSRTILKGNDSAIPAELQELRNTLISLKANVTEEIRNLRVEQTLMKEKDSKIMANVTNLENYVSKAYTSSPCPLDWMQTGRSCYMFSDQQKTWTDSQSFCQSKQSTLLIINNAEEQQDIISKKSSSRYYWIGLSDRVKEGDFRWVDDTSFNTTEQFWAEHQPDDWQSNEDCIHLSYDGLWNDASCDIQSNFICEKETRMIFF